MTERRGFTLLEVMVAMAILSLGLTIILSSQAGLFAATRRVQNETIATNMLRCKMAEVEVDLLEDGYSLVDQSDSGECCEDEGEGTFRCEWSIDTVELPQPREFEADEEGGEGPDLPAEGEIPSGDEDASPGLEEASSPFEEPGMGDAAAILSGQGLAGVAGVGDLAGALGESGGGGGGLVGMALGLVYPTLKPMLEASIRKVKVAVIWSEGKKERRFEVIQYVTNPMEGALNPNASEGLEDVMNQINGVDGAETSGADE
jgi:general secretion pathway protein I